MKYLIIGGAGFIGSNFAEKLAAQGAEVVVLDDLSRPGARTNLYGMLQRYPHIRFVESDISKGGIPLNREIKNADVVFHLAAQVGVTTSVVDPRRDFEINALGTLNVLEAARTSPTPPIVIYASTNKVYGGLEDVPSHETSLHYAFVDRDGIAETYPLDFHSPYGCSKGTGEQYVRDYARIYGLRTVVFRQSCIYGEGQFGTEDQGWVAWFIIAARLGLEVTLYGNGKQTRDILYISDLFEAWMAAVEQIDSVQGSIFNIGGGAEHAISLRQFVHHLERAFGLSLSVRSGEWRPGDQRIYISDTSRAQQLLNWKPRVGIAEGTARLLEWVKTKDAFFRHLFLSAPCNNEFKRSA